MNKALDDQSKDIKINGITINNLRYADDTVLLAETLEDLQTIINKIVEVSEEYGLTLNTNKTKYMLITKSTLDNSNMYVKVQPIERVRKYNYLGTVINEESNSSQKIQIRIEKAKKHIHENETSPLRSRSKS